MSQPFFSICIPSYNLAHLITDAIDSVLAQSYPDFELLIQDDVSTDNIEVVINSYNDPRILYEKNTDNLGIFGNLNKLCERARGRYIKILCADDMLTKDCLQIIHDVVSEMEIPANLIATKETGDASCLKKKVNRLDLDIFTIDQTNLFRFLCQKDNWGGGLAELCVEREYFKSRNYFGPANKHKDFSKDIITWFEMVIDTGALMIHEALVYQRPHEGQARYKLARITQLREMMEFFCERETEFKNYKDFSIGRRRYLHRYLVSHYWYGIKSLLSGHGTAYLQQVSELRKKFNYYDLPIGAAIEKVSKKLSPVKL